MSMWNLWNVLKNTITLIGENSSYRDADIAIFRVKVHSQCLTPSGALSFVYLTLMKSHVHVLHYTHFIRIVHANL